MRAFLIRDNKDGLSEVARRSVIDNYDSTDVLELRNLPNVATL